MGTVPMLVWFEGLPARGCITKHRGAVTSGQPRQSPMACPCRFAQAFRQLPLLSVIDGLSLSTGIVSASGL